jgi:hypothetical protein
MISKQFLPLDCLDRPSTGSSVATLAPISRATVVAIAGLVSVCAQSVVTLFALAQVLTPAISLALGSCSGDRGVDGDLSQVEALGKVAEGGVAGDEVLTLAGGQTAGELSGERGEPVHECLGILLVVDLVSGGCARVERRSRSRRWSSAADPARSVDR